MFEKRKAERYTYPALIEYVLDSSEPPEVLKAVTIDISKNGLCIYSFWPLSEGQRVIIKTRLPVDQNSAMIRWIKRENDSLFRIGLRFLDGAVAEERAGHA